jgi:flagellar biosynthesis/type III secretory pathway chaperone
MNRRATEPLLADLLQTLRAEQRALVQGDADALPALAGAKSQAFDRLAAAVRSAPLAERAELLDALTEAQRVNDTNAALVASRMAVNRARLDALLSLAGHDTGNAVYGAQGNRPTPAASPRASASA